MFLILNELRDRLLWEPRHMDCCLTPVSQLAPERPGFTP
jgi:hypothetical protein